MDNITYYDTSNDPAWYTSVTVSSNPVIISSPITVSEYDGPELHPQRLPFKLFQPQLMKITRFTK